MTLKLVKDGPVEVDPEILAAADEAAAAIVACAKAGGAFWLLLDGDEPEVKYAGDGLELACFAEEVARKMKLATLGLE